MSIPLQQACQHITLANLEAWLGSLDELDRSPVIYCGHKVASKLRSLVNANEDRILGHSIKVTRAFGSPSTGQVAAAVGYLDKSSLSHTTQHRQSS